jgi:hypothetical protein
LPSSTRLDDNQWHHAVGIKDAGSGKILLYVDGQSDGEQTVSMGDTDSDQGLYIGSGHLGRYMDVFMDEVAIWNEAITAAEITALYNSGVPLAASSNSGNYTSSANLKGYWRFNENSGTTAYDLSGNGNHGTLTNGPSYSTSGADGAAPTLSSSSPADGATGVGVNDNIVLTFSETDRKSVV